MQEQVTTHAAFRPRRTATRKAVQLYFKNYEHTARQVNEQVQYLQQDYGQDLLLTPEYAVFLARKVPFNIMLSELNDEQLGKLFRDYISETDSDDWGGFTTAARVGIMEFLEDLARTWAFGG